MQSILCAVTNGNLDVKREEKALALIPHPREKRAQNLALPLPYIHVRIEIQNDPSIHPGADIFIQLRCYM